MDLLEGLLKLIFGFLELPTYQKPRRVWTRGFVVCCVFVAITELLFLHAIYNQP